MATNLDKLRGSRITVFFGENDALAEVTLLREDDFGLFLTVVDQTYFIPFASIRFIIVLDD
jgi:hypothetical protein